MTLLDEEDEFNEEGIHSMDSMENVHFYNDSVDYPEGFFDTTFENLIEKASEESVRAKLTRELDIADSGEKTVVYRDPLVFWYPSVEWHQVFRRSPKYFNYFYDPVKGKFDIQNTFVDYIFRIFGFNFRWNYYMLDNIYSYGLNNSFFFKKSSIYNFLDRTELKKLDFLFYFFNRFYSDVNFSTGVGAVGNAYVRLLKRHH